MPGLAVSSVERRQALDALLASETLRRSDQLKRLLTYLCDQDEAGRIHEVSEYELGTQALGRSPDFAPDSDSSVRTRMHGLRQKLDEFYRDEAPPGLLRLEIPKGSYRPLFHATPTRDAMPVLVPSGNQPSGKRMWPAYLALIALAGLAVVAGIRAQRATPLDRLWKPILAAPQSPVLLVAQPLQIWVRDVTGQAEPVDYAHFPDPVPTSKPFLAYVRPRVASDARLVLHPSPNATLWGDAAGAAAAARFLAFRQVSSEFLPESGLKSEVALRGRPILAFGRPEYSPAVRRYLLAAGGYTVGMLNDIRRYAIYRSGHPQDRYLNTSPPNEVNHGLITVINDGGSRVFVFSGITSDGAMAGLDYFANEELTAQLWRLLQEEGHTEWPPAFQVVVRVSSSSGYAMAARYEKHLVLQTKPSAPN